MAFLVGSAWFSVIQQFFAVKSATFSTFLAGFSVFLSSYSNGICDFLSEFSALSSLRGDILLIYKDEIRLNIVKLCIWKSISIRLFFRKIFKKID